MSSSRRWRSSSAANRRSPTCRPGTRTKASTATLAEEGKLPSRFPGRPESRVDHRLDAPRKGDLQVHDRRLRARRHGEQLRGKLATAASAKRKEVDLDQWPGLNGEATIAKLPEHLPDRAQERIPSSAWTTCTAGACSAKRDAATASVFGVVGDVDEVTTSTLGKALGGAAGRIRRGAGRAHRLSHTALAARALLEHASRRQSSAVRWPRAALRRSASRRGRVQKLRDDTQYFSGQDPPRSRGSNR